MHTDGSSDEEDDHEDVSFLDEVPGAHSRDDELLDYSTPDFLFPGPVAVTVLPVSASTSTLAAASATVLPTMTEHYHQEPRYPVGEGPNNASHEDIELGESKKARWVVPLYAVLGSSCIGLLAFLNTTDSQGSSSPAQSVSDGFSFDDLAA